MADVQRGVRDLPPEQIKLAFRDVRRDAARTAAAVTADMVGVISCGRFKTVLSEDEG